MLNLANSKHPHFDYVILYLINEWQSEVEKIKFLLFGERDFYNDFGVLKKINFGKLDWVLNINHISLKSEYQNFNFRSDSQLDLFIKKYLIAKKTVLYGNISEDTMKSLQRGNDLDQFLIFNILEIIKKKNYDENS